MTACRTLALAVVVLNANVAGAQRVAAHEPLKKDAPPASAQPACTPFATPTTPTGEQRRQARELAQRGQQAAILGDRAAARDQLRQAAVLDPTDADLAYQLARADETAGATSDASREYCRSLALAPNAPEAAETRAHVANLLPPSRTIAAQRASSAFTRGLSAYERGQLDSAEVAFDEAIAREPAWASAYYDRAITRLARGKRDDALSDFQQYLRLQPDANDRLQVASRIDALQRSPLSPGRALSLGLVIPGAGQFYTGRPARGLLALAGAGAALACGLRQRTTMRTVQETALDPFNNPYTYTTTRPATDRPCLGPGIAVAGVIALASAIDAFSYAKRASVGPRVSLVLAPTARLVALRVTLR